MQKVKVVSWFGTLSSFQERCTSKILTLNIDLIDSLVNIQILYCWYSIADNRSTVDNIEFIEFGVSKVYFKFDDP